MEAARGSLVAFATAPGSVAADGTGRNGTYTKHLLLSLEQPEVEVERVFKRVAQGVSAVVLQMELSFWDTIKASTMAGDYQDYLNRYPNGQFAGLAQNRLNALRRQQNR